MNVDYQFNLKDVNDNNKTKKLASLINAVENELNVHYNALFYPELSLKSQRKEEFVFISQQDIFNDFCSFFKDKYKRLVKNLTQSLILKSKENFPKIQYDNETRSIQDTKGFNDLVKSITDFLNDGNDEKINELVYTSKQVGKALFKKLKDHELKKIRKTSLKKLIKNMDIKKDNEYKTDVAYVGTYVTGMIDKQKKDIQKTILGGIKTGKTQNEISKDLFDHLEMFNRDTEMIANTEIANITNDTYIHEAKNNGMTLFKRMEVLDNKTCRMCTSLNNKIAKLVDGPQSDEVSGTDGVDFVLWNGKVNYQNKWKAPVGAVHPNCRGFWVVMS